MPHRLAGMTAALLIFGCAGVIAAEIGLFDYTHGMYAAAENSLIAGAVGALLLLITQPRRAVTSPAMTAPPPVSRAGWRTIALFAAAWGVTIVLRLIAPSSLPLMALFMPMALLILPGAALMLALHDAPGLLAMLAFSPPLSLGVLMVAAAWAARMGIGLTPLFFTLVGAGFTIACLLVIARQGAGR
jgi:hypothetical protein